MLNKLKCMLTEGSTDESHHGSNSRFSSSSLTNLVPTVSMPQVSTMLVETVALDKCKETTVINVEDQPSAANVLVRNSNVERKVEAVEHAVDMTAEQAVEMKPQQVVELKPQQVAEMKRQECPICQEDCLSLKFLTCKHSMCLTCINSMSMMSDLGQKYVKCPFDRLDTFLPSNDVTFLWSKLNVELPCESCDAEKPIGDCWWCQTCQMSICSECAMKKHRTHDCDHWQDYNMVKDCFRYYAQHFPRHPQNCFNEKEKIDKFCWDLKQFLYKAVDDEERAWNAADMLHQVFGGNKDLLTSRQNSSGTVDKANKKLNLASKVVSKFGLQHETLPVEFNEGLGHPVRLPFLEQVLSLCYDAASGTNKDKGPSQNLQPKMQSGANPKRQPIVQPPTGSVHGAQASAGPVPIVQACGATVPVVQAVAGPVFVPLATSASASVSAAFGAPVVGPATIPKRRKALQQAKFEPQMSQKPLPPMFAHPPPLLPAYVVSYETVTPKSGQQINVPKQPPYLRTPDIGVPFPMPVKNKKTPVPLKTVAAVAPSVAKSVAEAAKSSVSKTPAVVRMPTSTFVTIEVKLDIHVDPLNMCCIDEQFSLVVLGPHSIYIVSALTGAITAKKGWPHPMPKKTATVFEPQVTHRAVDNCVLVTKCESAESAGVLIEFNGQNLKILAQSALPGKRAPDDCWPRLVCVLNDNSTLVAVGNGEGSSTMWCKQQSSNFVQIWSNENSLAPFCFIRKTNRTDQNEVLISGKSVVVYKFTLNNQRQVVKYEIVTSYSGPLFNVGLTTWLVDSGRKCLRLCDADNEKLVSMPMDSDGPIDVDVVASSYPYLFIFSRNTRILRTIYLE